MQVGISASQGQGKTTVLNSLQKLGYNIIPQKTSRSVLEDWGFTLSQVNSVHFLTQKFQEEVIVRHYNNIASNINSPEVFFQERSMADIFVYCLNILGPFNTYSVWMDEYYKQCKRLQQNYDCVIYLTGRSGYTPEDDGVRSTNKHFTKFIDVAIKHYVTDFDNGNVLYIDTPNHDERIQLITNKIEQLKAQKAKDEAYTASYDNMGNPHG